MHILFKLRVIRVKTLTNGHLLKDLLIKLPLQKFLVNSTLMFDALLE